MRNPHPRTSRRTQFSALSTAYDRFNEELMKFSDPLTISLAQSWNTAKAQYSTMLDDPGSKVTRSMIASGMKQGLREIPMMLRGLPPEVQQLLRPAFRRIVQEEVPGFFAHERDRTARIVKRGRLRNEDEWYIVRHRVDEIERDNSRRQELAALLELLEQYEGSG